MNRAGIWDDLLAAPDDDWADAVRAQRALPEDWKALAVRGGYPTPALELQTADERAAWFDGYVRTYLERDLQEISSVSALPDLRRHPGQSHPVRHHRRQHSGRRDCQCSRDAAAPSA